MVTFDTILDKIGAFGHFQRLILVLLGYNAIIIGIYDLSPVFVNFIPLYRCNVPPVDNKTEYNLTENEILNLTTPYNPENNEFQRCKRYGYNLTFCEVNLDTCVNKSANPIPCDKGYYFDNSQFTATIVSEFDLVCNRSYLNYMSTTVFMIGGTFGPIFFGALLDWYGRKPMVLLSAICCQGAILGNRFVTNVWEFMICRVILAISESGMYLASFVYLCEMTNEKWIAFVGLFYQVMYSSGTIVISGLAYCWTDWRDLLMVTAFLTTPIIVVGLCIPESARWLFAVENDEKAKIVTRRVAKFNRVTLIEPAIWMEASTMDDKSDIMQFEYNEDMCESLQTKFEAINSSETDILLTEEDTRVYSLIDIFKHPQMRKLTLKILFNWISASMIYYGLAYSVSTLEGNVFVNNSLGGVVEIVSYVIALPLMTKFGRRNTTLVLYAIGGTFLLSHVITFQFGNNVPGLKTLSVVFALIGRMAVSGVYGILYNFTAELYPTVVRGNALAISDMAAHIGSILSILVIGFQSDFYWLPGTIFSFFSICCVITTFTLPETAGRHTMKTIEEAELFYSRKECKVVEENENEHYDN